MAYSNITNERWQQAQIAERQQHKMGFNEGIGHYFWAYRNYFKYLGIERNQQYKYILEIGPADFPALMFCENFRGAIIEPMPSPFLSEICSRCNIALITRQVEIFHLPKSDEIWLFNIMQHVQNPDEFVNKCKESAETIRFFEPIDQPTCEYHPHTFSKDDYVKWYGGVQNYTDRLPGFFDADCVYGIWKR